MDKKIWLHSAPTQLHIAGTVYSTGDGSLQFVRSDNDEGTDAHGQWAETQFEYQPKGMDLSFWATIRVYKNVPMILFGQVGYSSMTLFNQKLMLLSNSSH